MKQTYEDKLLHDWEDVFKQGLLTFWLFLVLSQKEGDVREVRVRIEELTGGSYAAAEQTLYRLLRKHYDLELVDFREVPGKGGPNRKLYSLSATGRQLLAQFAHRNIQLFMLPEVQTLLNTRDKK